MARLDRREPPPGAVAALNETLGRALARRRLAPTADGLDLAWDDDPAALDAPRPGRWRPNGARAARAAPG